MVLTRNPFLSLLFSMAENRETAQSGKALELNMCITLCEIVLLSDSKAFQRPQLLIAGSVIVKKTSFSSYYSPTYHFFPQNEQATAYILSVPSSEINFPILLWGK